MITVHKTEIARQNNTWGAHVLLRGAPSSPVVRTLLTRMAILTSFCV